MGSLRAMTDIFVYSDSTMLPAPAPGRIPVLLYGSRPEQKGTATIGARVLDAASRVEPPVPTVAFDFLSWRLRSQRRIPLPVGERPPTVGHEISV